MISEFDNCLFIHIPKTAGQSVESVFLERAGLNWNNREAFLLKPNSDPKLGPPRLSHLTALEYIKYGYLTQNQFNQLYKFSVVRNPWDRLVSEYTYQGYTCSFKDFIFKSFPKEGYDDYVKHHGHYRHVMPQYQFLCDENENLIIDDIIKFESLQKDFSQTSERITGETLFLPHKNKTSANSKLGKMKAKFKKLTGSKSVKKHYSDWYDDETREFVRDYYAKDILLFDYTFEKSPY